MGKISVVISAYNEEKNIEDCLKSVKELADEIIVVDNSSTDRTADIASKFTKKVYKQKNDPTKIDLQKNFGFEKATGDWILSLDADERVTEELAKEIRSRMQNSKSEIQGYWIPRKNIIFGKWIEHTGWYPDYLLRLFKRGKGEFVAEKVHEPLVVNGETEKLSEPIYHENYKSVNQFINKMIVYTDSESKSLIEDGYKFSSMDIIRKPFEEFLSRFFAQEGYKDGLHGLALSLLMAFYRLLVFLKIWEYKKFFEEDINVAKSFKDESRKIASDVSYWVAEVQKKETRNPVKRLILQTSQKIR